MKNLILFGFLFYVIFMISCSPFPSSKDETLSTNIDTVYSDLNQDTLFHDTIDYNKYKKSASKPKSKSKDVYKDIEDVNYDLDKMVTIEKIKGDINYVMNDTMKVGITEEVNMTISHDVDKKIIIESVESFQDNEVFSDEINISKVMRARLIDPTEKNFTIVPITQEEQMIENNEYTIWRWDVTPLTSGNNKLILSVDIVVDDKSKSIEVYDGDIFVFSDKSFFGNILLFFKEYWEPILGVLTVVIIPVFTYFYRKYKKKKARNL